MNSRVDQVKEGELYPAPNDEMMPSLAGCSHGKVGASNWRPRDAHMPQLELAPGEFDEDDKYAWVGLARRVDIDRVFQLIKDSNWFQTVEAMGSFKQTYKVDEQ